MTVRTTPWLGPAEQFLLSNENPFGPRGAAVPMEAIPVDFEEFVAPGESRNNIRSLRLPAEYGEGSGERLHRRELREPPVVLRVGGDQHRQSSVDSSEPPNVVRNGERTPDGESVPRTVHDEEAPPPNVFLVGRGERGRRIRVEDDGFRSAMGGARERSHPSPTEKSTARARLGVVFAGEDDEEAYGGSVTVIGRTPGRLHALPG